MDMNKEVVVQNIECFECEDGRLIEYLLPYKTTNGVNEIFIINDVPTLVCDKCGTSVFSSRAGKMIDDARVANGVVYRNRKTP